MAYNTVLTTVGKYWIVDMLDATTSDQAHHIGWGTGAGDAAIGDTTISTEGAETRVVGTQTQPAADKNRCVGTLTSAAGGTITNAGLLTLVTVGVLVIHANFASVVLLTGDKIEFTFDLQIT